MNPIVIERRRASQLQPIAASPVAIIDIGSNSVRLVVYRGGERVPLTLFNEKVMCGLGKGVGNSGALDENAMVQAERALARYAQLIRDMGIRDVRAVATAAVRDASNGPSFVRSVEDRTGLAIRIISGEEEARLSALGVVSGIPGASGIVADLGGGSMELVRVENGLLGERISLPIGPLNLLGQADTSPAAHENTVRKALDRVLWMDKARGQPIYMVGGAWRALCHLHMNNYHAPVPIIHQYEVSISSFDELLRTLKTMDKKALRAIPKLADRRMPTLPIAGMILQQLAARAKSSMLIASSYGLREGFLYEDLSTEQQQHDPLLAGARLEAEVEGRFPEHGDMLMDWMEAVFRDGESPKMYRLRYAACLLSDVAWRGHPDFRARRAVDISLYGNFVGLDARERAILGLALHNAYGGDSDARIISISSILLNAYEKETAIAWGYAIRLGQRLTGGAAAGLVGARLRLSPTRLTLQVPQEHADLVGEPVEKRLKSLAEHLHVQPAVEIRAA
jgi:exopolyphosphatase / guanosine-5'-triphosphate,3'-diphosphate pyrophosphatase